MSKAGAGTLSVSEALPASSPAGPGGFGGFATNGAIGGRGGGGGGNRAANGQAAGEAQAEKRSLNMLDRQQAALAARAEGITKAAEEDKAKMDALPSTLRASDEAFAEKDLAARRDMEQMLLYRQPDRTMELAENNYYHLPITVQIADLVKVNGFWNDYAQQKAGAPFLSKNLAEPASNFTEIMFALSVLDLPFEEPVHVVKRDAGTFTLTAGGPVIAFHKQIKEAQLAAGQTPILVSQNYFRYDDRYTFVDNERTDKYITPTGNSSPTSSTAARW